MVFSSTEFLTVFLPLVLLLYFVLPVKLRNGLLLVFSLVFYAWGEPVYVLIMLASIMMNYLFGLGVAGLKNKRAQKALLALSVVFNIGLLGVFKYADFAINNVNSIFGSHLAPLGLVMPIGISFFTFQAMSYVIDVYRGDADVQKNPLNFGLYISLFPQLIAGPIVRYRTVAEEINRRSTSFDDAAAGVRRFVIGLGKKVLIANNVGFMVKQMTEVGAENMSALSIWLALGAYGMQIYFDFSGYSDMAIGLGRIFGFHFLENFNYPFVSKSVTEIWNRWHISLGTWFKEYLYIPLGGSRKGKPRQILNLLIVWFLTGLWHGASWNFVLWGLYFGVWIILEKFVFAGILKKMPSWLRHCYAMLVFWFSFLFVLFEDKNELFAALGSAFGSAGLVDDRFAYFFTTNAVLLAIGFVASMPWGKRAAERLGEKIGSKALATALECAFLLFVFILSLAFLIDSTYNPFIYFRF